MFKEDDGVLSPIGPTKLLRKVVHRIRQNTLLPYRVDRSGPR
jgi:hypothetical protein